MIENFEYQDLQAFSENERVSTLGTDLRREEAARTTATSVDALRSGGTRSLIGGLGRVQAQNNLLNRELAANLDQQQVGINTRIAQQRTDNQRIVEQRDQQRLAGFGQLANIGFQTAHQGLTDIVNGIGTAGQGFVGGAFGTGNGEDGGGGSDFNFEFPEPDTSGLGQTFGLPLR